MIYKLLKISFIISLCFYYVINSLAAVSVSDGSTFVTKAEFAADLSNISNRMAQAENSIDARIDSLVSAYLTRNGIWNGASQIIQNNLGTSSSTAESMRVLENVDKTGLVLIPYTVKIEYKAGICFGATAKDPEGESYNRAMGSPIFYMLNIQLGMYNEATDTAYQTKDYFYGLTSEYDTASIASYRLILEQQPSGIFMFFLSKGDNVKYKMVTSLNARMDWWSLSMASPITGNNKTLSGKAIAQSNGTSTTEYGKWMDSSYYTISFGIKGLSVAVY